MRLTRASSRGSSGLTERRSGPHLRSTAAAPPWGRRRIGRTTLGFGAALSLLALAGIMLPRRPQTGPEALSSQAWAFFLGRNLGYAGEGSTRAGAWLHDPKAQWQALDPAAAETASVCMPVFHGYPSWNRNRNRNRNINSSTAAAVGLGECDRYWGYGYREPKTVFGEPPDGLLRAADEAVAAALSRKLLLQAKRGERAVFIPHCLKRPGMQDGLLRPAGRRVLLQTAAAAASGGGGAAAAGGGGTSAAAAGAAAAPAGSAAAAAASQAPGIAQNGNSQAVTAQGAAPQGWLRCFRNGALGSSVCEASMLAVYPQRIAMSVGGERLDESIRGRPEAVEFPHWQQGAMEVPVGGVPGAGSESGGSVTRGVYNSLFDFSFSPEWYDLWLTALRAVPSVSCARIEERPTLLVIRYEYVNLYHTATDWFNAFQSARVAGLRVRPQVVFLDGHAQGNLDSSWASLFGGFSWIKSFEKEVGAGAVCFRHAVLVPLGYFSPIFTSFQQKNNSHRRCVGDVSLVRPLESPGVTPALTEFGEFVAKSLGAQQQRGPWAPLLWPQQFQKANGDGEGSVDRGLPGEGPTWALSVLGSSERWRRLRACSRSSRQPVRVLFARRDPAWVHPRQENPGAVEGRMDQSQEELLNELAAWTPLGRRLVVLQRVPCREGGDKGVDFPCMPLNETGEGQPTMGLGGDPSTAPSISSSSSAAAGTGAGSGSASGQVPVALASSREAGSASARDARDDSSPSILLLNGTLVHWNLKEQVAAAQWADVIVGAHGAALTHVAWMRPDSALIELRPSSDDRDFYEQLAWLRGMHYMRLRKGDAASVKKALLALIQGTW